MDNRQIKYDDLENKWVGIYRINVVQCALQSVQVRMKYHCVMSTVCVLAMITVQLADMMSHMWNQQ